MSKVISLLPNKDRYLWQKEIQDRNLIWGNELDQYFDAKEVQLYYDFLLEHPYFFSKKDQKRILERHLYECLIFSIGISEYFEKKYNQPISHETNVLDVGSGPGLPGFLFYCLRHAPSIFLLDSSRRKLGKLADWFYLQQEIVKKTENQSSKCIHFIYERLEEHKACYDCIVCRAFVPFPIVVEICSPLQKIGGILALALGHADLSEKVQQYCRQLGYVSRETIIKTELKFLGLRQILILEKVSKVPLGYSRSWKQTKSVLPKNIG